LRSNNQALLLLWCSRQHCLPDDDAANISGCDAVPSLVIHFTCLTVVCMFTAADQTTDYNTDTDKLSDPRPHGINWCLLLSGITVLFGIIQFCM
jgi:hypothetical protein